MQVYKLAIVGTSHLSEVEEMDMRKRIALGIKNVMESTKQSGQGLEIITGDAAGVDTLARQVADGLRLRVKAYVARTKSWDGPEGFKARNGYIAKECDGIICLSTKVKRTDCYHCDGGHERTGGCWTLQLAKSLGKHTKLVVI